MEFVLAILTEMGRVMVENLTSPSFLLIYLVLFALVAFQYRRLQNMSEDLIPGGRNIYLRAALVSCLLGILGGVLGSILLVFLGVDLAGIGITQLWLVAIVLMLIKPRFLCFAYAGGLLSISSLLFGYPAINIPQLIGLVAALHMVESLLILLNGANSPFPVYVLKNGALRGGFNLQRFWPIPLVALINANFSDTSGGIITPAWWPILHSYSQFTPDQTYALLPILAILGYGEICTTKPPRQAVTQSSLHLFLFSLALMLLAVLSARWAAFLPLAAVFSPLGHELVIWIGMRAENRPSIYTAPAQGVMILDVLPGSQAARAGLKSHDIIVSMDGEPVNSHASLQESWGKIRGERDLLVHRDDRTITVRAASGAHRELGIVPVPDSQTDRYYSISEDNIFMAVSRLWRRIKPKG